MRRRDHFEGLITSGLRFAPVLCSQSKNKLWHFKVPLLWVCWQCETMAFVLIFFAKIKKKSFAWSKCISYIKDPLQLISTCAYPPHQRLQRLHHPDPHFPDDNYGETEQCCAVSFSVFSWETAPLAASMHIYHEMKNKENLRLTDNIVSSFCSLELLFF